MLIHLAYSELSNLIVLVMYVDSPCILRIEDARVLVMYVDTPVGDVHVHICIVLKYNSIFTFFSCRERFLVGDIGDSILDLTAYQSHIIHPVQIGIGTRSNVQS